MVKQWYQSRTVWLNFIAIVVIIVQSQYGYIISEDTQIVILGLVNLALRAITGEGLDIAGYNLARKKS